MDSNVFQSREVFGMKGDLWAGVCGIGSETWERCEWVELLVVRTWAAT